MNCILHTRNREICLRLAKRMRDTHKEKFWVKGRANSNYAFNEEIIKSVSRLEATLNSVSVAIRVGKKAIALLVVEAELIALV